MSDHVLLGLEKDDVHLGRKQAAQHNKATETHRDAHGGGLHSVVTGRHIKYREKGQPNDARCVHCETDKLGFVEVLWTFPGFEGIHSA